MKYNYSEITSLHYRNSERHPLKWVHFQLPMLNVHAKLLPWRLQTQKLFNEREREREREREIKSKSGGYYFVEILSSPFFWRLINFQNLQTHAINHWLKVHIQIGISFMFLYCSPNYARGVQENYFYAKNLAGEWV